MGDSDSEWLQDPVERKKRGYQVIVHDPEPGPSTLIGRPHRWRWMARHAGHIWRRHSEPGTRVEIRRVRRTDAPRGLP